MINLDFQQINSVKPPAAYLGGKLALSGRLVKLIERIDHKSYAEPFVGMGGVFLRRKLIPRSEVINDISGDVVALFRVLKRHYVPLMDELRFTFTSRREFERLLKTDATTLTDIDRAVRFLYLQRLAFGGKITGRHFGVAAGYPGRFDVSKLESLLADINERLSGVVIENLHYTNFITRYDSPDTLFYLDPPYFGCETDYGKNVFTRDDFANIAALLATISGQFILSINDTPEIREVFSEFDQQEVKLTYSVAVAERVEATELIITPKGLRLKPDAQMGLF
jgi:DNA adenine methylase